MANTHFDLPGKDKPLVLPFQKRKQLSADVERVTAEMYRRNLELAETNRTLSLLRTIDAVVLESHASLKSVSSHITEAITQTTSYPFVGLFTRTSHDDEVMHLYGASGQSWIGKESPLTSSGSVHIRNEGTWIEEHGSSRLLDLTTDPVNTFASITDLSKTDIRQLLSEAPIKSLYCVKLLVRRRVAGVLMVGFYQLPDQLPASDTDLIDRLSESIGVALDNKLLFEENRRVMRKLKETNAKLRELDEAKDDFVSMASHQLRTPLTSVKGYISMVLEGDAGEINDMQRKLLSQSFFSSQRMVYLIADLLNVSRLKTGKFMIDRAPVNLSEVVAQEIAQLQDTATSHNLELIYTPPKTFPELLLDETKTRQIIMNFVDNAIYYTPANGKIHVKLVETETSVEFRVEDNGIGVPKNEQAHLFTKFYRAGNARKARPDGTGLGLFMAKKVVVAEGGALIFESTEGKGSTFGFIFSKSKVGAPIVDVPVVSDPTQP